MREGEAAAAISLQQTLWNNITETITNIKSDLANLLARITNTETQITTIQDSILSGSFIIPQGAREIKITYPKPFASIPSVQLTPISTISGRFYLSESTMENFMVNVADLQSSDVTFNWLSLISTQSATIEVLDNTIPPSETP